MVHANKIHIWTKKELEVLKKYGSKLIASKLKEKIPNKPKHEIFKQRKRLGIKAPLVDAWSKEEIKLLKEIGSKYTAKKLVKYFPDKSENQITRKRERIGIKVTHGSATEEEVSIIKKNYLTKQDKEIAKLLINRNRIFVTRERIKLGLTKRDLFIPFPKYFYKW